jgi:type III secretion protein V
MNKPKLDWKSASPLGASGPGFSLGGVGGFANFGKHSDLLLIGLFVAIIALMVLPLPPWALDGLIAANLTVSVVVLIVAVYIRSPLGLSTFPALLLFTTLFRLSLNIASTRQILLTGNAGEIIKTFGNMVVGGDVIVGLVVFLIIALVQFIVIAKGSERIAEVGARFSLDAMPGKQMSIDADLRAGIITKDEARSRRHALESESQLYGAMDGAMKFVKGDAIAAIIIAAVNIIGGIAVGMLRKDMSLDTATHVYSVLAVGDAMVSQIPSLFMSVAAGIVVTRVAKQDGKSGNLAQDILAQIQAHPRALMISGVVVLGMGFVPGFPLLQFSMLAVAAFVAGWWASPAQQRKRQGSVGQPLPALTREGSDAAQTFGEAATQAWASSLTLRIAPDVMATLDASRLDDAVALSRMHLRETLGLPFPGLVLGTTTEAGTVSFDVHSVPALSFAVPADHALLTLGSHTRANRIQAGQPGPDLFGLPTRWVPLAELPDDIDPSLVHGVEAALVLAMQRLIESRPHKFLGVQEALVLSHQLEAELPELDREMRQAAPLPRVAEVCRWLLEEGVSLRDLSGLAQALVDHAGKEKDTGQLVEKVRRALTDQITHQYTNAKGELAAVILSPELEEQLAASVRVSSKGSSLALPQLPKDALIEQLTRAFQGKTVEGLTAVLLVHTPEIRPALRNLLKESDLAARAVLSVDELRANLNVLVVGEIDHSALGGR